jgi:hypothetical protein
MATPTRLAHPVSDQVKIVYRKKDVMLMALGSSRPLRGVLNVLKSNFYPTYSYEAAKLGPTHRLAAGVKKIKGGQGTGRKLDRMVSHSILLLRKYGIPMESLWDRKAYLAASKRIALVTHRKWLKEMFNSKYIQSFWLEMQDKKLRPMSTQVAVRHKTRGIGTMADLVCLDAKGAHRVIELKTGFEAYHHKHTATKMKAPFHKQTDSPFNQHQLQLAATSVMYQQTFPQLKIGAPLLLRFHSSGVETILLTDWAEELDLFSGIRKV